MDTPLAQLLRASIAQKKAELARRTRMISIDLSPRTAFQVEALADRFERPPEEIIEEAVRMASELPEMFGRWLEGDIVPGDDSVR